MSTTPTEKFVRDTVDGYNILAERIKEVAIQVATIQGTTRNPVADYFNFNFDGDKLYAKFEYMCWGDNNEEYVYLPLEYLWTKDFIELEKDRWAAECKENARLAEEQKQKEAVEVKRLAALKERQTYERLKKKYEDVAIEEANHNI